MLELVLEWRKPGLPGHGPDPGCQSAGPNQPGLGRVLAQEQQVQYQTLGWALSPPPQLPVDSQSGERKYKKTTRINDNYKISCIQMSSESSNSFIFNTLPHY